MSVELRGWNEMIWRWWFLAVKKLRISASKNALLEKDL